MATFIIKRYINADNDILGINVRCNTNNFTIRLKGNNSSITKFPSTDEDDKFSYEILPYGVYISITRFNHNLRLIRISEMLSDTVFDSEISEELFNLVHHKMERLMKDYPIRVAKSRGRNLVGLREVGEGLALPENVESHIGSFLSGKTGSTKAQTNKLRQNLGESLAPRAGGKRTRRRRRQ